MRVFNSLDHYHCINVYPENAQMHYQEFEDEQEGMETYGSALEDLEFDSTWEELV